MPKRILIDSTHAEEVRVVILENGRVVEYDSETSVKKQLKGNIYLCKVTRVEPSLQAAFVDYGGDRQGFLPFSEIHPKYYDIPVADKEELLKSIRGDEDEIEEVSDTLDDEAEVKQIDEDDELVNDSEDQLDSENQDKASGSNENGKSGNTHSKYNIQEVIKRNDIILVQVEKEERGNKGVSLTSFLSLAGRYCVLMPNSLRKGGVSRRIENREDRKRLKNLIKSLELSSNSGLIIRTAGAKKDNEELISDYEYLTNLWDIIVKKTMESKAPEFIHAEGDILIRTMRDLYNESIDEVLIEGKEAFASAKDFIKVAMSSHANKIKQYKNKVPIFSRYKVEEQIAALYSPEAGLESGGALVINPTEALISIDVNSGRSTGQKTVEETAFNTNIEAAREVARQLRLRDLSGLIVIDFIDMMEAKNRKAVERALKEAFAGDKAKIQIGRISTFGLLEMSRQRLSASFLEVNTMVCPHCQGAGVVKATDSTAVTVLRAIENDISRVTCNSATVFVSQEVALYILNYKREAIERIQEKYSTTIYINVDQSMNGNEFAVEKSKSDEVAKIPDKSSKRKVSTLTKNEELNTEIKDTNKQEKESRRDSKQRERKEKKYNQAFEVKNIFDGLWKKIIE